MTTIPVTPDDLIATRERLIADVGARLVATAQRFLTTLRDGDPDIEAIGLRQAAERPALRWKLLNLKKLGSETLTRTSRTGKSSISSSPEGEGETDADNGAFDKGVAQGRGGDLIRFDEVLGGGNAAGAPARRIARFQ